MADWTGGDVGGDLGAGDSGALDISSGTSEVGGDSPGDSFAGDTSFESVEALDTGSDVSFEGAAESPDSGMETQDFEGAEPMQEMGEGTAVGGFESGNLETEDSWDSIEAFENEDITDGVEEDFTDDTEEDVTDGTEEGVTDGTEEGVTDGTEEDVTDGTEEGVTDGAEEDVTDGTEEDVTDSTEENVTDGTEEGVTDDTEEDVTDGTEEDVIDGNEEDVTDGTEEDVTDSTEEGVTDDTEEDVTDDTDENVTDSAEEGATEATEEDVTDGTEEDVTDGTEEDVADDTEEGVTDGTEDDVTDGIEENVTDGTEEDVTDDTEEGVTDGVEEDVADGTEEDVTDDTEEGVTDGTEEDVTDGTEEGVTDGAEEDVTDGTEEDVTDGIEEGVTDGTEEDVTDDTEEGVTDGAEEDVTDDTEEDVTDNTEEGVTDGTEEDVTDSTEEGVTDGTEEDATDGTAEDVTDGTEEDITDDTDENVTGSAEEGATEAADDETDSAAAGDTTVGGVNEVDQNAAEGSEDEDSFRDLHTENMQAQQLENQEEEKQNSTELDRSKEPVLEKDEENPEHTENLPPPPHDPNNPENFSGPHGPKGPKGPNNLDTPENPENNHPEKLENPLKELPRHQQYELQKQENQRKLERAMDDAFGREGGRRMEMGRLVEQVNELTAHRYELAQEISKQDPVLDKYTDHGPEHIKEVATNTLEYSQAFREFAQSQGIEPGSEADIKSDVLLTAALYHDTGMDGGLESIEEYQQKCAAHEAQQMEKAINEGKIKEYGDVIRSGHPSQSAMHVLEDAKALQEKGIDPNEVAALTYLHSKSNSGVRVGDSPEACSRDMSAFMQRCEQAGIEVDTSTFARQAIDAKGKPILDKDGRPTWEVTDKEAFVRREFEVAMQNLHGMAQDRRLDFDPSFLGKFDEKGNFTITNEQAYTRLQYETAVLRLADAQRPAQKFTTTHSGKTIELTEPDWEQRETKIANGQLPNTLASELNAVDARFTGPATGASVSSVESRLFTDPQQNRASWDVSKKFYTGESNVDRGQVFYNPESGKLEIEYRVKDGCKAPHATVEILRERMAECRMPVLDGKTEQVVVLERTTARSLRSYRRGIGSEKGCRVRV